MIQMKEMAEINDSKKRPREIRRAFGPGCVQILYKVGVFLIVFNRFIDYL